MRLISVRDLRTKSAQIWKDLQKEREMVVTSNGKPVGILSATTEETLEQSLAGVRRARMMQAVSDMQLAAARSGKSNMSLDEINRIIRDVRRKRRQ